MRWGTCGFLLLLSLAVLFPVFVYAEDLGSLEKNKILLDKTYQVETDLTLDGKPYKVVRYENYIPFLSGYEVIDDSGAKVGNEYTVERLILGKNLENELKKRDRDFFTRLNSYAKTSYELNRLISSVLEGINAVISLMDKAKGLKIPLVGSAWDALVKAFPGLNTLYSELSEVSGSLSRISSKLTDVAKTASEAASLSTDFVAGKEVSGCRQILSVYSNCAGALSSAATELTPVRGKLSSLSSELSSAASSISKVPLIGGSLADGLKSLRKSIDNFNSEVGKLQTSLNADSAALKSIVATVEKNTVSDMRAWGLRQNGNAVVLLILIIPLLILGGVVYARRKKESIPSKKVERAGVFSLKDRFKKFPKIEKIWRKAEPEKKSKAKIATEQVVEGEKKTVCPHCKGNGRVRVTSWINKEVQIKNCPYCSGGLFINRLLYRPVSETITEPVPAPITEKKEMIEETPSVKLGRLNVKVAEAHTNRRISQASVLLKSSSGETFSGTTGRDGTVNFQNIPPGKYSAEVSAPEYNTYATSIQLYARSNFSEIVLQRLSPDLAGDIVIKLHDRENRPIANAVAALDIDGNEISKARTDADGKAVFKSLPRSNYNVTVFIGTETIKRQNITPGSTIRMSASLKRDDSLMRIGTSLSALEDVYRSFGTDIDICVPLYLKNLCHEMSDLLTRVSEGKNFTEKVEIHALVYPAAASAAEHIIKSVVNILTHPKNKQLFKSWKGFQLPCSKSKPELSQKAYNLFVDLYENYPNHLIKEGDVLKRFDRVDSLIIENMGRMSLTPLSMVLEDIAKLLKLGGNKLEKIGRGCIVLVVLDAIEEMLSFDEFKNRFAYR